jgi:hypothetical protein
MQNLIGISSGQNNKSCRIIHHESNKIGFAFFWFFYDFLRNLQESGNSLYYFSCTFAGRPSERSWFLQCSPWGGRPARGGQIPASRWPGPAGSGRGLTCRLLWLHSGVRLGLRRRRACSAQPHGGGRWTSCPGEPATGASWPVTWAPSVGSREGGGALGLGLQPAGPRARRGCL